MICHLSYPAVTLKEGILPALGLTVAKAANQLGVSRSRLSRLLNGHTAIKPEMALRLEKWLAAENGGRADLWLAEQAAYDLWQARSTFKGNIKPAEFIAIGT